MQALVLQIGAGRYAIALRALARVLPAAALDPLPQAPSGVAGLLNLHGAAVPVLDLAALAGLPAAPLCYDSRILVIDYPTPDGPLPSRPLGLLVPHVLGVEQFDAAQFQQPGVAGPPFLGQVVGDAHGFVRQLRPAGLLDAALRARLFAAEPA